MGKAVLSAGELLFILQQPLKIKTCDLMSKEKVEFNREKIELKGTKA
jgi:hypothetical protein